jgi:hypothetical protein
VVTTIHLTQSMVLLVFLCRTNIIHTFFLATLDLPDLSRLTNDPISHSPVWPVNPTKLPSYIPKFDRNSGEDSKLSICGVHQTPSWMILYVCVFSSEHLPVQ